MERRDALRMLRSEIGLTQAEFAAAINVGYSAESRWENQNTRPNRSSSAAILALAKQRRVSAVCLDALTDILLAPRVNDKEDKALTEEVTERMKVEQRELLTSNQLKAIINNLDLAVIGQRIFSGSEENITVFYHNKRYAEIFGYDDEAEFDEKSDENVYFGIPHESQKTYLALLKRLLRGGIALSDFVCTISGFKRNGDMMWLEVKGVALTQFSFGYEIFVSCRDVTEGVDAERKYSEEIAVREATLQGFYASFHCDIETNQVFRHRDTEKVTGRSFSGKTIDEMLALLEKTATGGDDRLALRKKLCRENLLAAYERNELFGSVKLFSTIARRWLRVDRVLIKNPYTNHVEAVIYIYDIQNQVCAEKMTQIVADRFFEYIDLIDAGNGSFESYYYDSRVFRQTVSGKRDYQKSCEEKLRRYGSPEEYAAQRRAASLATIKQKLSRTKFYTIVLRLQDYDGEIRSKRVTYSYMDETKTIIVMAQSDRENIEKTFRGCDAGTSADVGRKEAE